MTEKEIIEIVKESSLWEPLTDGEKQAVISHVLSNKRLAVADADIEGTVGEVYLGQ